MGDCKSVMPTYEGEQHIIAAAQHIVRALGAIPTLTVDLRKILTDFDTHLSAMNVNNQSNGGEFGEVEKRLKCAEEKIGSGELNQSMIWDYGPIEACEYFQAVDEVQRSVKSLRSLSSNEENQKQKELLHRADSVLQIAMSRLEIEAICILDRFKQYLEPEIVPFRSSGDDVVFDESFISVEDKSMEEIIKRDDVAPESSEYIVDLIDPHVIPHLKLIANIMFASNYVPEFSQAFINSRKDALDEYLLILEIERYSIEDLLKMEWDDLNCEIKKCIRAMKIIFRVYLASERKLCNQIFEGLESMSPSCFVEIPKASIMHFLNFVEAMAMSPRRPEKLFRLLDIYEVLEDLLLDIDTLFPEESDFSYKVEFHELLSRLGDSAKETFLEFGIAISSNSSINPFPSGGIHHLTRYVMNYIKTLTIYAHTVNFLLEEKLDNLNRASDLQNIKEISGFTHCPMAIHLRSISSYLISNLHNKSKLYKDDALQQMFLMNNIHYMVQKVQCSDLRFFFGNGWIRDHIGKLQQHATIYERTTWSSILSLLKDEGSNSTTKSVSKKIYKEKCRAFSAAFEEVYKTQTAWLISDFQLREDLQISISQKVIHAYRTFLGRNSFYIRDKYVKYSVDDLGKYILDLFEGSPRSLHNPRRQ